ncbi:AP-4 complex accessory subunit RUSC1 isoform X2 [Periophthalmus magnuspinnatus]|uniref:AP-4 complex accessory subunit RUSC1 isoform X2 n=1 Tax=Periophthalmus magnuspinnatus TaxID=409849 RepID=UPI002436F24F|nr:AP-4 complex accessory subunit RUSC1 isoform X2 [Periophthalmus magnuspinnatus]
MLAGLTQAELLKISPELGNCVGGLEEEADDDNLMSRCEYTIEDREDDKQSDSGLIDSLCYRSVLDGESEDNERKEERKETQKTTSFSEMARRRRRNTAYVSAPYYSTGLSNTSNPKEDDYDMILHYASQRPSSPPPPPPPRPLPPIPSSAPPKISTLPANSTKPERFDWLIAFTPDSDAPPKAPHFEMRKRAVETPKKSSSSSLESSSTGSAPKTTTFKELRNRKSSLLPTKVITDPDPDPNIITPDPDLLYNLKWRRDKAGDGTQWEYTSQAQALFMQPPPALTSMAALQEMLQRAEEENGKSELSPSQNKLGYSVSDSSLWNLGAQWEREEGKMEEERKEGGEVEVRGQADGERTTELRTSAVRSVSFAGHRAEPWMDHDVRAPVRGLGLSPQTLQEKRALVSAVSVAVEAILAQFSTSRTIVQKALSGDSTVNPSLGRLVLQCLCPALHSLLTDGLKPHQSDLIAGRRPNNAWGLVQASTRPGSKTQALFNLQTRVGDLPQLKQSKHRFNAFILGLLNIKHLDFWVSHLHTSSDVLETYYHPSSFMRLSLSACHHQFEELLLVLQPLSLLTFNLDLLFQHHHVDPHPPKTSSVAGQDAAPQVSNQTGEAKKSEEKYMESLSEEDIESGECRNDTTPTPKTEDNSATKEESLLETSPQLRWVKEKEISSLPPPNIEEDSLAQQAGQVIQQGWEVMVRWGGRLSQNLSEMSAATAKKEELKTEHLQTQSDFVPVSSSSNSDSSGGGGVQMPWGLDRLFGAPKSLTSPGTHPGPTRRPSQWLAPGVSVLTRMVSSSTAPMLKKMSEPKEETSAETQEEAEAVETKDQPRPLRSVRTLCDHRGTGSELTFSKGEELQVLGGVDQDWIRCRRGNTEGLVPIGYTSLIM